MFADKQAGDNAGSRRTRTRSALQTEGELDFSKPTGATSLPQPISLPPTDTVVST